MLRRHALSAFLAPALIRAQSQTPTLPHGVQSGDIGAHSGLVWTRADRPSRMIIEVSLDENFRRTLNWIRGPFLLPESDFTGHHVIEGLPASADVYYRIYAEDLSTRNWSEAQRGRFRTAANSARNIRFHWSADMVGQGYGINPNIPGMPTFQAMLDRQPDFFIHSGDTIYADGPLRETVNLANGTTWRNMVTEAKSKVAETLTEFRGNYQYNLTDRNVQRFNREVAQVFSWDDHEVTNNYSPGLDLSANANYREKSVDVLTARGTQAFLEYAPIRRSAVESHRIFRKIAYGPLLDVFVLDLRSYRGPNTFNRQTEEGPDTAIIGAEQRAWLKRELVASRAVWKVFACDMPIGLTVGDGRDAQGRNRFENQANGDGPALGRELEFADLLQFLKNEQIRNFIFVTGDVHYTAAHRYSPERAQFQDFEPFWEFVSGPMNAASLNPGAMDNTFGIERVFAKGGAGTFGVVPENQFFGEVDIDGVTHDMKVTLRDAAGNALFSQMLPRQRDRIALLDR
jgi:alkaline phosphatase D